MNIEKWESSGWGAGLAWKEPQRTQWASFSWGRSPEQWGRACHAPGSIGCVRLVHPYGGLWPWRSPAVAFLICIQCIVQTNREINYPETRDCWRASRRRSWGPEWEFSSRVPMKVNEMKCEASCSLESSMCVNDSNQTVLKEPGVMRGLKGGWMAAWDSWRCPRPLKNHGPRRLFRCGWENQHN